MVRSVCSAIKVEHFFRSPLKRRAKVIVFSKFVYFFKSKKLPLQMKWQLFDEMMMLVFYFVA
jgi:hypothetical protein